jgi:hypothetical protein
MRRAAATRWPAVAAALALALAAAGCGGNDAPAPAASTLEATLVDRDGDGALERGPGEALRNRTELAPARDPGAVLATVAQITDAHVRDEESPARVPFLDRLGAPFNSTFRPQEALSTQVLAATVRAVNRAKPEAVFVTGDLVDSASQAEYDEAIRVLDGGTVDPDTGAPGYDGVQAPDQPDALYYRPDLDAPRHPGLLDQAQRAFRSPGLDAPWYATLGNHDLLVQGEQRPTPRIDEIATGTRMVVGLEPGLRPTRENIEQALDELPGRSIEVPADAARRHVSEEEAVERLGGRTDYAVDLGARARALVLDTHRRGGRLTAHQLGWLRAQLAAAGDRKLLVFSHNALPPEALALLDRAPGVVATVAGNSHRNAIRPRRPGGYWQITTSSLADHPQQARVLRLREHALETWMLDHDGRGLAGTARELAFLDAQGGRPQGFAGTPADRNARLFVAP